MEMTKRMIESHPAGSDLDIDELANCITHCYSCAQTCTTCADACLSEDNLQMLARCIRLNLDCADVCVATGAVLSRLGSANEELLRNQLRACKAACDVCGSECDKHSQQHEHCRICADSCRKCADACDQLLSSISAGVR